MRDTVGCAWRELTRRKGRTTLNVLGYALAVGTLVTVLTVLLFARRAADAVLENTGTFFAAYEPASCEVPCYIPKGHSIAEAFVGTGGIYTYSLAPMTMANLQKKHFKHVKRIAFYTLFRFIDTNEKSTILVGGFDPQDAELVGPTAVAPEDVPPSPDTRYLRPGDHGVVLVERTYAEPRALSPGAPVMVAGKKFNVLGIVDTTANTRAARANIYMTRDDLAELIARRIPDRAHDVNMVLAEARSSKVLDEAKAEMARASLNAASGSSCHKPAVMVLGMNEKSILVMAVLISLFTLVSSMKSQYAAVIERRRDIGILKAIGWTHGAVTAQIFVESLLQAAIGGVVGCAVSALIVLLVPIARIAHIQTNVPLTIDMAMLGFIGLGMALAVVGGGVAGALPAFIAARQRPAIAMRQL